MPWLKWDASYTEHPQVCLMDWQGRMVYWLVCMVCKRFDKRGTLQLKFAAPAYLARLMPGLTAADMQAGIDQCVSAGLLDENEAGTAWVIDGWKNYQIDARSKGDGSKCAKSGEASTVKTVPAGSTVRGEERRGDRGEEKEEEPPTPIRGGDGNECPKFLSGIEGGSTEMEEWMLIKGKDPRTDAEWAQWVGMCRMRNEVIADCITIRLAKAGNGWAKRQAISSKEAYEIVNGKADVPDFSKTFRSV